MNPIGFLAGLERALMNGGLRGSFLVRNLTTGEELGFNQHRQLPAASLIKIPLAMAVTHLVEEGALSYDTPVRIEPARFDGHGPGGLSKFRHDCVVAVEDLLWLSTALSDTRAADALFDLVPPRAVNEYLNGLGNTSIILRKRAEHMLMTPLERAAPEDTGLIQSLAAMGSNAGSGQQIEQLDLRQTSVGTAHGFVELLDAVWNQTGVTSKVAMRIRELMSESVQRHRLAPDFESESTQWFGKTGTLLNLRHEIGVAESAEGEVFAIAAMTESTIPVRTQPAAEQLIGQTARFLRDALRAAPGEGRR
ncbi:serine hydrolase [Arthrobacter frigidicola]|nr:serine hydrolase [Arthrobacter frigidicola]